jgi:hypothetical protein
MFSGAFCNSFFFFLSPTDSLSKSFMLDKHSLLQNCKLLFKQTQKVCWLVWRLWNGQGNVP